MPCIGLYRLRDYWDLSQNHWRNFQRHRSELSTLVFPAFGASILFWLQHFLYLLLFLQHSCVCEYILKMNDFTTQPTYEVPMFFCISIWRMENRWVMKWFAWGHIKVWQKWFKNFSRHCAFLFTKPAHILSTEKWDHYIHHLSDLQKTPKP